MLEELKVLEPPGIKPIKMVELYSKWGPLLPEIQREITCPKPPDAIIIKVRDDKSNKAKKRKAQAMEIVQAADI